MGKCAMKRAISILIGIAYWALFYHREAPTVTPLRRMGAKSVFSVCRH